MGGRSNIGTKLAGRYELLEELARGGMGVVYLARDPLLERRVAVKMLASVSASAGDEKLLRREAQVVARLDHPAIVPIYDFGRHEETFFFVMPWIQGTTLQTLVREKSLSAADILEIVAQAAEALDYSHAQGVIHRDIKPQNLMVMRWPGDGVVADRLAVRLMDFGLAVGPVARRLTQPGNLPGTLAYLSPEQVLSETLDGRSDLYSLGVVLFECLTGEPPFLGSAASVLYRIVHEPAPRLSSLGQIDEALDELVAGCLAKGREDRPARGHALALALRQLGRQAEGLPVEPPLFFHFPSAQRTVQTPFIGRRREIAELQRRLDAVLAGEHQWVLIAGEAGMGKSRLLAEVESLARTRGARVLRGRCAGQEKIFPFQVFCELIQEYFRGEEADGEAPDTRLSDLAVDLIELFPVLAEIRAVREAAHESSRVATVVAGRRGERRHFFELMARVLLRLAGGEPLVLLLEHLHEEGAASEALQYIVRRLGPSPILVVGTYQPSEIYTGHPLGQVTRQWEDDPRFVVLKLGPLSRDEHRQLLTALVAGLAGDAVRPHLADDLTEELYKASGGHLLFSQELVRSLLDSGRLSRAEDGTVRLEEPADPSADPWPETIHQVVETRLARLDEEPRQVLAWASVLGRSFDVRDLQSMLEVSPVGSVDETLDRLLATGLLEEDPKARGERFTFVSGMVCDVLYRSLPRRRRRRLHQRCGEQLEEHYRERLEQVYPQLVHHFSAAEDVGKTVRYGLALARRSLAAGSAEDAIRAGRTVLALAGDNEDADILAAIAELHQLLARAERAAGHLETAFAEAKAAVRAFERAGKLGAAAVAALVATESAWQARLVEETRHWVDKGLVLARQSSQISVLRRLLILGATAANLRGESQQAMLYFEEAEQLEEAAAQDRGDEKIPHGGTLVTVTPTAMSQFEPTAFVTSEESEVLANVFEPLLATHPAGHLMPRLASGWEASPDGDRFELHLRRGIRFSNGEPLDAAAVKRSLERTARLAGNHLPAALATLTGVDAYRAGDAADLAGVIAKDEMTVELSLAEPLPIFPALLSDPRTAIVGSAGEDEPPPGTGPFRLARLAAEKVILERNPHYWREGLPRLDRLEVRVGVAEEQLLAGLRSGELDLVRLSSTGEVDPWRHRRASWVEATRNSVHFLLFNGSGPLAQRRELRRALIGVIHVRDLVWQSLGRSAEPAVSWLPPGVLGHDPGRRDDTLDVDEARSLLNWVTPARPIRLATAIHPRFRARHGAFLDALFELWNELGVEIAVETSTMDAFRERYRDSSGIDLLIGRWIADYDDPDNFTYGLFHSRHGLFADHMVSRSADPLLEMARHEGDPGKRVAYYRQAEERLAAEHQLLPLFYDVDSRLVSRRVRGLSLESVPPYVNYAEIAKEPARPELERGGAAPRGTVTVPLTGSYVSLDPLHAYWVEMADVVPNVFETLTRVDPGARIVPHLAEEVRMEDGGQRCVCKLREEIRFHDGRRFTARDVRYSLERLLADEVAESQKPLLAIRGAKAYRQGAASEVEGLILRSTHELAIELDEPVVFFPAALTQPLLAIVPEGTTAFDGSWRDGCAGTGPFRLVHLEPGRRIELAAHPRYWRGGLPRVDRLIFELGLSSEQIAEGYDTGYLDVVGALPRPVVERLWKDTESAAGYHESPGFSTYFLAFNTRRPPFDQLAARQTLIARLNLAMLSSSAMGRLEIAAEGLIPPGLQGYEPIRRRGREAAAASFDLGGRELEMAVHSSYFEQHAAFWQALREAIEALGITLRLTVHSKAGVRVDRRHAVDLAAVRWFADYPDPDTFMSPFGADDEDPGLFWVPAELERLIVKGRGETDPTLRHHVYVEIERFLLREALILPLFHEQVYRFAGPRLTDVRLRLGWPQVAYEELAVAL